MLEYLRRCGSASFADLPLNDVDRLIFAQLAYLNFGSAFRFRNAKLSEALGSVVFDKTDSAPDQRFSFQQKDDRALCTQVQISPRYSSVRFLAFVSEWNPEENSQFAALSLLMPDERVLIAFRGTDNTLAGWKEDFDMAYKRQVPAQIRACSFVEEQTEVCSNFELCGHSKGGNLALYAAAHCGPSLQSRLLCAVSFDGPGLETHIIESEEFLCVQNKLRVLIPRASLVGLLFNQPEDVRIVESRTFSILQHYPYTWKTAGSDFRYTGAPSRSMQKLGLAIRSMLEKMTLEIREQFIESIYEIVASTGADTLNDLVRGWIRNTPAVVRKLMNTDRETYRLLLKIFGVFWLSVAETLGIVVPDDEQNADLP